MSKYSLNVFNVHELKLLMLNVKSVVRLMIPFNYKNIDKKTLGKQIKAQPFAAQFENVSDKKIYYRIIV